MKIAALSEVAAKSLTLRFGLFMCYDKLADIDQCVKLDCDLMHSSIKTAASNSYA